MTTPAEQMPTMSESQRIGMLADRCFKVQLADHWIATDSAQQDYGWDYWISLTSEMTGKLGPDLFVQLKGTGSPHLVVQGAFLSQSLEVRTINYLLCRSCPALLAVCDLEDTERPVYWVWLNDALNALGRSWQNQSTVNLRVPKSNLLRPCQTQIEQETLAWHEERAVERALAEAATLAVPTAVDEGADRLVSAQSAKQRAIAAFAEADLVDIGADPLDATTVPEGERALRSRLREAKTLLDAFDDRSAARVLDDVERALRAQQVGAATRATLLNRRGVIALRHGRYREAVGLFSEAASAAPADERYASNLVTAQTLAEGLDDHDRREQWIRTLDRVLARKPGYAPALAMKARLLATVSPPEAEELLRSSPFWQSDPGQAQLTLADILVASDPDRALAELNGLPPSAAETSHALSLRGFLLFRKALGESSTSALPASAFGPAELQLPQLAAAADAYEQACARLANQNYPRFAADVFRNAAQVLVTAGRPRAALRLCESFLSLHPDATSVSEAAAVALNVLGRHDDAAAHLSRCFAHDADDHTAFRNLLMALYAADRFTELHDRAKERLAAGPPPEGEQVCWEFLALAAAELGAPEDAEAHLARLAAIDQAGAVPATAAVWFRAGRPPDEIRAMLRAKSNEYPSNGMIAGHLVQALLPVSEESADEIRQLLEERVSKCRQLSPREMQWLGRAYAELGHLEAAESVFRRANARFPDDQCLPFDWAVTLADLGEVDEAYAIMVAAARLQPSSVPVQQNLALLAASTGRLDQAIGLFDQACSRTSDATLRRALAGQLYELRRRRGDGFKDLLRAAMIFGECATKEALTSDLEARFLMMCLVAGTASTKPIDHETAQWSAEIRRRLTAFCDKHPKHKALRRFTLPDGIKPDELETLIFSDLFAESYPAILLGRQFEIAARGVAYPLCIRARLLPSGAGATVPYWQHCIRSQERSDRIYSLASESVSTDVAKDALGRKVVVDLTSLLTLKHLALLDEGLRCFAGWVVSDETRRYLEAEAVGRPASNQLARELCDWLITNREHVAARRLNRSAPVSAAEGRYAQASSGLWLPEAIPEPTLFSDGLGASLRLAGQLGLPFFSDEAALRQWAHDLHGIRSFGTVEFLAALRERGNLAIADEAMLLSNLLRSNYSSVPFGAVHVHASIKSLVDRTSHPDASDLNDDAVVGVFIRKLGDPEISEESVASVSGELLALCVSDPEIPVGTTAELAYSLSFKMCNRAPGGLLTGISSDQPAVALARVWVIALFHLQGSPDSIFVAGWSLMRQTVGQLNRSDLSGGARVSTMVVTAFVRAVNAAPLSEDLRNQVLLRIARSIPEDDRQRWFAAIAAESRRSG